MPEQITESMEIAEAESLGNGRYRVLCISEGKGSSGIYPRETLIEAANKRLIGRQTFAYLDHPSASEHHDRPERSVRDLAGVFTSEAIWDETHKGLVAEMQVFAPYRELVAEMKDHIGLSIRGDGEVEMREGQRTVTSLAHIESVDFVTRAGRGGKVLSLLESARPGFDADDMAATTGVPNNATSPQNVPVDPAADTPTQESQEDTMPQIEEARLGQLEEAAGRVPTLESERDAAIQRATEAEAQVAKVLARDTARPLIATQLAEATEPLPIPAQARVAAAVLAAGVPTNEQGIDTAALTAAVESAAKAEAAYLAAISPKPVTEAWGSFGVPPAARTTDVVEADALKDYDAASARTFGRTIQGA